jgi:hypothetical protein
MGCYILCMNCLLKHVIKEKTEGRMTVIGRRERSRKKLLDDLKEGQLSWKFKK